MIGYMGAQQKKQLEGLEELALFTSKEVGTFKASMHPLLLEQVHQALAKAGLAVDWLNEDVSNLDGLPSQSQLVPLLESLGQNKSQVGEQCLGYVCVLTCLVFPERSFCSNLT